MMNKPILEPIAVSAAEAARLLGVSRPKVYELMNREDFPSFRLGGRTLISVDGLRRWVEQQVGGGEEH
jgi:excisionase family DNA binding protein